MRLITIALAVCAFAQNGTKRPLSHRDYDSWRSIHKPTLSHDGRYLAYGLFPQEGDGELVVRDLRTDRERRQPAGQLPPPPEPSPDAEPGEQQEATIRILFSYDGRFVAFSTFPTEATVEAARKAKKDPPKRGLGVVDLQSEDSPALRVDDVKSFQVPAKGPSFLAYLKEGPKAETSAPPRGTDLVLRDLASGSDQRFEDVLEYSIARDGKTMVYAVASANAERNGVYAVTPGSDSPRHTVLTGTGKYSKLTWDAKQTQLAFFSNGADAKPKLNLWKRGDEQGQEIVSAATPGFRNGFTISERGRIGFARDGSRIVFGTGPPAREEKTDDEPEPIAVADLWHYKDSFIQPMQKVRAKQERNRSYTAVYHLARKKLVQIADEDLSSISLSDDGRYAIGSDDRAYRSMIDYDRLYTDYYLVDTLTGSRKPLLEKGEAAFSGAAPVNWSPDGRHALFFRNRHWHVILVEEGSILNITRSLPVNFFNEEEDRPQLPSAWGTAGWTRDGKWILLYDQYDVWQISPDGRISRNLTDGVGRASKTQFRVVRLEREEEDEPRGIDPKTPLLLRAEHLTARDSGFWRDRISGDARPEQLLMGPRNYRALAKAARADVVVMTASTFAEFPDLQITDTSFHDSRKVTDANPQKAEFLWGTAELIAFRSVDGKPLQAALYKPENFDPSKKYPMLVYIYERLSQNVHNFMDPRPSHSPNISYYVSNGYLVLTPDIAYTTGHPGQSALKCVLPAVQAAVDRGGVNEGAIGIAGHSWGGYQVAYLTTQTRRFRAAEAGAPVSNMTSAYNGIRWGTGLPRQFQYERAQSRIGGSLWDQPLLFLENSPVFHVRNVDTPLLILHNDQDDAVPWYQGIELYLSLRRNGKEAYLFNYNGEKHHLRRRPNQKDYTARMQQFFDHHLKDGPKPLWMTRGIPYLEREEEKRLFLKSDQ